MIVIRYHRCFSLAAQPRPALVQFGEGGARCSDTGSLVPQLQFSGSSSLLPAVRKKAGLGKGSIIPVGFSRRQ